MLCWIMNTLISWLFFIFVLWKGLQSKRCVVRGKELENTVKILEITLHIVPFSWEQNYNALKRKRNVSQNNKNNVNNDPYKICKQAG